MAQIPSQLEGERSVIFSYLQRGRCISAAHGGLEGPTREKMRFAEDARDHLVQPSLTSPYTGNKTEAAGQKPAWLFLFPIPKCTCIGFCRKVCSLQSTPSLPSTLAGTSFARRTWGLHTGVSQNCIPKPSLKSWKKNKQGYIANKLWGSFSKINERKKKGFSGKMEASSQSPLETEHLE